VRSLHLPAAPAERAFRVLAVGCHPDDIEIGAGATLLRLQTAYPDLEICWMVLAAHGARSEEARASAVGLLGGTEGLEVVLHQFRDGHLPYSGSQVKDAFEAVASRFDPDLILTHHRQDLHQDHRLVCEVTWNTFRNHLVLEYEIPKYDGDLGHPNVFVAVDEAQCRRKVRVLMEHFGTQRDKHWFTEDVFLGLMRLRGVESRSPTGYAEAFHGRKLTL
jgi:LmbE family N-acetylglucosaminyl deacetylase